MSGRLQLLAIVALAGLLLLVLELVRRRRLMERYALLWMLSSVALLALAIWDDLLSQFSHLVGIEVPSNALFAAAFGFVLLLLIHFSLAISRLSGETKVLAQRLSLLDAELRSRAGTGSDGEVTPGKADTRVRVSPRV